MTTRLLVAMVNYRTADLAINAVQSAEEDLSSLGAATLEVVDNDSADGSFEKLDAALAAKGDWARVVRADRNGGFSYGNNFAIRPALNQTPAPEFVLLLNPDTEIERGAIVAMVNFLRENPKAGIAGARIIWPDGTPRASAFRFPGLASEFYEASSLGVISRLFPTAALSRGAPEATCLADWVPGAAMMIRKEVFDAIGLMDEDYFLYFEELDFCLQANRAGWECWYLREATVMHIEGQATGVKAGVDKPARRPNYWFDSRRRFFVKNHGRLYGALCDIAQVAGLSLWHLKRVLLQKPYDKPEKMLTDIVRHSALWNR